MLVRRTASLVVADSSALIALASCDALELIMQIYDDIKVPEAVYEEIVAPEKPQSDVLGLFLVERVMKVDATRWVLAASGLGRGEIEAMALYKELSADALLIDDHRARVIAEHNQINCIGALGLLLLAKQKGTVREISPYIQKLRTSSIHYGDALLDKVLKLAGE
jgi:predicted nucleic acid-binding protein